MKVKVTQSHINDGHSEPELCPIALALKEALGPNTIVEVTELYIIIDDQEYKTPDSAGIFIHEYDSAKDVTPFEFELAVEQ